jgi:hypothetical protein
MAGHITNTTYTLSGFLKPMSLPEPYVTPKPSPDLAKYDPRTKLTENLSQDATEFSIQSVKGFMDIFKTNTFKVICIGNEMIEFKSMEEVGGKLLIKGAERGAFKTEKSSHTPEDEVIYMFVSGYHNFYPGTVAMNNEMATNIARDAVEAGNRAVVLDGHESCFETGHGDYALNQFAKIIYDMGGQKDRLMCYSITQQNYNWHMMSYQSWGEYEIEKGFRGTCLDYRLMRQLQYRHNLVPNKMGQYYPSEASAEDVEWLMARTAGWQAGVDFNININQMLKNPDYKKICSILKVWEKAKAANAFSEKERLALRQTDRLYHLEEKSNGKFKLEFKGFWQDKNVKISPPSAFTIKADKKESIQPLSIKWSWTHNPAIFTECGLSDDLIHTTGNQKSMWTVKFPATSDPRHNKKQHLQPVVRIPASAPTGAKNIRIKVNGATLLLGDTILNPGEYLSIPHDGRLICIYDMKSHQIKREYLVHQDNPYWYLPEFNRGEDNKVEVTCSPIDEKKQTTLKLNLRYSNIILPKK